MQIPSWLRRIPPLGGSRHPVGPRALRLWLGQGVLLLALAACSEAGGSAAGSTYPFRVGVAERGDVHVTVEETGVVEPERRIVVKSPISGVARRLYVREGDSVRAGQLLATVVPDIAQANSLAQLRSELEEARLELERRDREYRRARGLEVGSMITEEELEGHRIAYEQARARVEAARERLRLIQQSGVVVSDSVKVGRVTAPAAGVVIEKGIEEGETVVGGTSSFGGGTELFTVADLSTLLVQASVNEVDIGKVATGDSVHVTVDAFPGDTALGRVRLVPPAARLEERIRVFDVEIEVLAEGGFLRPGMTANVAIAGPTRSGVVRVPVEAVFYADGTPVVYRVSGGQARRTPVDLGLSNVSHVEVREGVQPGDSVALEDPAVTGAAAEGR